MSAISNEAPNRENLRRLARYDQFLLAFEATIDDLPSGPIADRYHQSLRQALALMAGERAALAALYAAALAEDAHFDLLRGQQAERLSRAYQRLALASDDAQPKALELGIALYSFHQLIVLFWLYDRSPQQEATQRLLKLTRELFTLLRPMFFLPMVPQGIAKLADIVLPELKRKSERAAAQENPRDGEHQNLDIHRD